VLMGRLMVSLDVITAAIETPDEDAKCRAAVLHEAVDWQRAAADAVKGHQVLPAPLLGRPEGRGLPGAREGDRRADGSPATPREGW
jgi:hypothetical protein